MFEKGIEFRAALASEADRRFGPDVWLSVSAAFTLADGQSELVRVLNTRTSQEREVSASAKTS